MTAEWQHVSARFHAFVAELEPTPKERYATWKAATDVGALLRWRFPRPAFDVNTGAGELVAIGSHGKGTALRGSRTADAMFVVPNRYQSLMFGAGGGAEPAGRADGTDAGLPPLVRDMIALLRERYGAVKLSPDNALSVMTDIAVDGEKITIRTLPCFAHERGFFVATRAHARNQGYWSNFDPHAEARNLDTIDTATAGKARHLIRMLKAWRRTSGAPIASLALERLACEFLRVWIYQRRSALSTTGGQDSFRSPRRPGASCTFREPRGPGARRRVGAGGIQFGNVFDPWPSVTARHNERRDRTVMRIARLFTKPEASPYESIEFRTTISEIRNPDGSVVFHQDDIEVPADWSQVACDVLAQKYFRKAGVPARLKAVRESNGSGVALAPDGR